MSKWPAIALVETSNVAAGAFVADKMVKRAPIELLHVGTVQPGRFLILVGGGTAEVEESYREGLHSAGNEVIDAVFLPDVHQRVMKALEGDRAFGNYNSLVVLETSTAAAILRSADAAVKSAQVKIAEIRLANGLGGHGLAILTGELTDVEAAAETAQRVLAGRAGTLCHSIVSNVDPQFAERLGQSSRFFPK